MPFSDVDTFLYKVGTNPQPTDTPPYDWELLLVKAVIELARRVEELEAKLEVS